jgi:hypothetical protein
MPTPLYLMPPLPAKSDLLRQLLREPHAAEVLLGATGRPILALIMSAEHVGERETRLYRQILRLIAQADTDRLALIDPSRTQGTRPGPAVFQLKPDLWVDLDRYEVRREGERFSLRAREAELLRILLRQPCCYVRAEVLAEAIGSEGSEETEHPVEEIVSNVRRALGEIPYHPKLLLCKRYAGYAIFPDESLLAPAPPQLLG